MAPRKPSGAEWLTTRLCSAHAEGRFGDTEDGGEEGGEAALIYPHAAALYSSLRILLLAEAFAKVREALSSLPSSSRLPSRPHSSLLRLLGVTRKKEHGSSRLAALHFSTPPSPPSPARHRGRVKAGAVYLLYPPGKGGRGLACGRGESLPWFKGKSRGERAGGEEGRRGGGEEDKRV